MPQITRVPGNGHLEDVARYGPGGGRVDGEATSEHCRADEERVGGAAGCLYWWHEGATKDYPEYGREVAEDQGATDTTR